MSHRVPYAFLPRCRAGALALILVFPAADALGQASQCPGARTKSLFGAALDALRRCDRESLQQAVALFSEAAESARREGCTVSEGELLLYLAPLRNRLGAPEAALMDARRATDLLRDRPPPAAAMAHTITGESLQALGFPDSAVAHYRLAFAADSVGVRPALLSNLGAAFHQLAELDSARIYLTQAVRVSEARKDSLGLASSLNNLGRVLQTMGRPDSAITLFRRSIDLRRRAATCGPNGASTNNLAYSFNLLGQSDTALHYLQKTLTITRATGNLSFEGMALINIGRVHLGMGHKDSALTYVREGLAIKRQVGDRTGESWGWDDLGSILLAADSVEEGKKAYYRALELLEQGDRSREGLTLHHLARLYHRSDPAGLDSALRLYEAAANLRAGVRVGIGDDSDRLSFAEQDIDLTEDWALAWLARGSTDSRDEAWQAALAVSERGRAQALLDLLRATPPASTGARGLLGQGAVIAGAFTGGIAALSYLATTDTLLGWFIHDGRVDTLRHAVGRDSLATLVTDLRDHIKRQDPRSGEIAAILASFLVPEALVDQLQAGAVGELVVVSSGPLALLPFDLLPLPSSTVVLGDSLALRSAPSFAVLREVESAPSRSEFTDALVAAYPSSDQLVWHGDSTRRSLAVLAALPAAHDEARNIAGKLGVPPGEVLLDERASEAAVKARLADAPLVHLASHGFAFDEDITARNSFVALAPGGDDDGLLTVAELVTEIRSLSAELVVLSACETGLGDLKQAEGIVGLQRAFLSLGARSVLVSLWQVPDESTRLLMEAFYDHWLSGTSKAEALRRAKHSVRGAPGSQFHAPRYWAAFQLVGAN